MISAAERAAPIRKVWEAGSAASSSARASASVRASGNILRPKIVPARCISAFHCALSLPAPSRQVTTWRSMVAAPPAPAAPRVANSNIRAGEAPADGVPVAVTSRQRSVDSRRSSAVTWPSSNAWNTHWRA